MIKQLKRLPADPVPNPRTPRCDADISDFSEHERQWRLNRYGPEATAGQPFRCSRDSVVEIGGKNYCRLHGGHKALDMLLKGELVEKPKRKGEKCEICGGAHDNDALTDICKACEQRLDEEGSP